VCEYCGECDGVTNGGAPFNAPNSMRSAIRFPGFRPTGGIRRVPAYLAPITLDERLGSRGAQGKL
jgi:hypothetical protein